MQRKLMAVTRGDGSARSKLTFAFQTNRVKIKGACEKMPFFHTVGARKIKGREFRKMVQIASKVKWPKFGLLQLIT